MNTDTGEFVEESKAKSWMERIEVGEVLKLKGAECKVMKIDGRHVILKLMSAKDRRQHRYDRRPPSRNELRIRQAQKKRNDRAAKRIARSRDQKQRRKAGRAEALARGPE